MGSGADPQDLIGFPAGIAVDVHLAHTSKPDFYIFDYFLLTPYK